MLLLPNRTKECCRLIRPSGHRFGSSVAASCERARAHRYRTLSISHIWTFLATTPLGYAAAVGGCVWLFCFINFACHREWVGRCSIDAINATFEIDGRCVASHHIHIAVSSGYDIYRSACDLRMHIAECSTSIGACAKINYVHYAAAALSDVGGWERFWIHN